MNKTAPDIEVFEKAWDDITTRLMQKVNPAVGVDALRENVQKGNITLYEVKGDGLTLGVFLVRVERLHNDTKQLVILHAAAEQKIAVPFSSVLSPVFDEIARQSGLTSIRIHSEHRGLDAIIQERGYRFQESVFVKDIF